MKKSTRKLTKSLTEMAARRAAATRSAATRRRCPGCGSFLNVQGNCNHPDCQGQKARW